MSDFAVLSPFVDQPVCRSAVAVNLCRIVAVCPAQATAGFLQAAGVRFNSFFSTDQHTMVVGLVEKFHADLGKGFAVSPSVVHPPPSFEMDRCMYYTLAHEGGAPDLTGYVDVVYRHLHSQMSPVIGKCGRLHQLQDLLGRAPCCFSVRVWV